MFKNFSLFFLFLSCVLSAQSTGIIYGTVTDENGFSASTTDIFIDGTTYSAFTDENGYYELEVDPGTYDVTITSIGYGENVQNITVKEGERVEYSSQLKPAEGSSTQLAEAVVVGETSKESEASLLNIQKNAIEMKQAIGADEISRKGVSDVSSAVAKISGVSQSEGVKNVYVRGLGDRYNSTSMNGLPLASEDPEYKNIALEFFNTDIIKNINVNKTFGADLYGDVAGANIDIASKELDQRSFFSISMGDGYSTSTRHKTLLTTDGSNYFGFPENGKNVPIDNLNSYDFETSFQPQQRRNVFNTNFSLMGGGKLKWGTNSLSLFGVVLNNSTYDYNEGIVRQLNSAGFKRQDMTFERSKYTASQTVLGNIKYRFGAGKSIALNSLYIHDNHQSVGDYTGFYTSVNDNDFADKTFVRRQQMNNNNLFVNQLLFEYKISDKLNANLSAGYNIVRGSEPDRKTNSYSYDYDDERGYFVAKNSPSLNNRFFSTLDEDDWVGKFELDYTFNPESKSQKVLTLGGNYRNTKRTFEFTQFNFDFNDQVLIDISQPDNIFNQYYLDLGKYNGGFNIVTGRGTGADAFDPFYYLGERKIMAAYAQLHYPFTEKFSALIGFRYENVNQTIDWDTNLSSSVNDLTTDKGEIKENYFLPSLNLKYDFNQDNVLRFSASRTYTLPQFKETALFLYEDVNFSSFGNPYLIAADNLNFDLKYDWYLTNKEIFSIGGFYKLIQDPINRVKVASAANELSYVNTESAFVTGVELEARKVIFGHENEGNKNDLSVGLNVSYLYSEQKLTDSDRDNLTVLFTNKKDQLEGASPLLINSDLSYNIDSQKIDFTTTLVFNYFYDKIFSLGTAENENIVEKAIPTLDFVNKIRFKRSQLGFDLTIKNILNPDFKLTQETYNNGNTEESLVSTYKKGLFLSFGITWTMK